MKTPPINWTDLITLGMNPDTIISYDGANYILEPPPSRFISKLFLELSKQNIPDNDIFVYLRCIRDILMNLTDWTQANDCPLSNDQKTIWAAYRQSLRDLPQNYSGEGNIPWPVIPS